MKTFEEKLKAIKQAITERIELNDEIKAAGMPPHSDFWGQCIWEANKKLSDAYEDLGIK